MAIEISRNMWTKTSLVVHSMEEVHANADALRAYEALTVAQKELFKTKVTEEEVTTLQAIIAAAPKPQPTATPTAQTPHPERLNGTITSDEHAFKNWIIRQATLVDQSAGLGFSFGPRQTLKDGTISVEISIVRDGGTVSNTRFYIHYHPGVKGAGIGHAEASKGHFKPTDGSKVRAKDHHFTLDEPSRRFYALAMGKAKGKK